MLFTCIAHIQLDHLNVTNKNPSTSLKVEKEIVMLLEIYSDYYPRKKSLIKFCMVSWAAKERKDG